MKNIKIDDHNYRIHEEKNKSLINKSLKDYGAGRSILIDNDNTIIAGNGVYEQAEKLGISIKIIDTDGKELIALRRTDLSKDDEARRLLAIADNRTSDISVFDFDMLKEDFDLEQLFDMGFDMEDITIDDVLYPDELVAKEKNNPPFIKVTFENFKQSEAFEKELQTILERYPNSKYTVGGGEL